MTRLLFKFDLISARCIRNIRWHLYLLLGFALHGLASHLFESVLNVHAVQRARLVEDHVVRFLGPRLAARSGHLALVLLIEFIAEADEGEGDGVRRPSIVEEALLPLVQVLERLHVSQVVRQRAAVRPTVESVAQRLELLLARGVPNLERNDGIVNQNLLLAEISANGGLGLATGLSIQVLL